jgi:hypothetical protein
MTTKLTFNDEVRAEVIAASDKFPGQETTVDLGGWLAILVEEVGEVARELNELLLDETQREGFARRVRSELVQVAAMAERMALAVRIQVP